MCDYNMMEEYFDKIGWNDDLRNVQTLIQSHEAMRERLKEYREEFSKTREELVEENEQYLLMRFKGKYIEKEKLRLMTLEEILSQI